MNLEPSANIRGFCLPFCRKIIYNSAMKKRFGLFVFALLALFASVLTACGSSSTEAENDITDECTVDPGSINCIDNTKPDNSEDDTSLE